jgi:hypothetical protein
MLRFFNKRLRDLGTTKKARPAGRAPRRAQLQLEGLEDRTVLSTVSPVGTALLLATDPGPNSIIHGSGTSGLVQNNQQIALQADSAQPGKVKEFTIKKTVDSASPAFFKNCCPGSHYATVTLN